MQSKQSIDTRALSNDYSLLCGINLISCVCVSKYICRNNTLVCRRSRAFNKFRSIFQPQQAFVLLDISRQIVSQFVNIKSQPIN